VTEHKLVASFFETFALKAEFEVCETKTSVLCKQL
jgi:hypothetical protein